MTDFQDVESNEDAKLCDPGQDLCYGKLTIANVNLTLEDASQVDLLEIKIEKGCAKMADFEQTSSGTFDEARKCWTTGIREENVQVTLLGNIIYDNLNATKAFSSVSDLDFDSAVSEQDDVKLMWQQELCICDLGDRCNSSGKLLIFFGLNFVSFAAIFVTGYGN